ncbi:hypothetical protein FB45DRAFT_932220 [Roridomyces roridus]|uniref:Uncharacterized protein n=1 Tax=Roridomyces roridus TaxID=1738132 RepID=A0AAD7BF59_9AGAR|nr:hypothetical protein FB45DRAFT_932220 [Roridomyces roridus]
MPRLGPVSDCRRSQSSSRTTTSEPSAWTRAASAAPDCGPGRIQALLESEHSPFNGPDCLASTSNAVPAGEGDASFNPEEHALEQDDPLQTETPKPSARKKRRRKEEKASASLVTIRTHYGVTGRISICQLLDSVLNPLPNDPHNLRVQALRRATVGIEQGTAAQWAAALNLSQYNIDGPRGILTRQISIFQKHLDSCNEAQQRERTRVAQHLEKAFEKEVELLDTSNNDCAISAWIASILREISCALLALRMHQYSTHDPQFPRRFCRNNWAKSPDGRRLLDGSDISDPSVQQQFRKHLDAAWSAHERQVLAHNKLLLAFLHFGPIVFLDPFWTLSSFTNNHLASFFLNQAIQYYNDLGADHPAYSRFNLHPLAKHVVAAGWAIVHIVSALYPDGIGDKHVHFVIY